MRPPVHEVFQSLNHKKRKKQPHYGDPAGEVTLIKSRAQQSRIEKKQEEAP
jgi:hypothetical protein